MTTKKNDTRLDPSESSSEPSDCSMIEFAAGRGGASDDDVVSSDVREGARQSRDAGETWLGLAASGAADVRRFSRCWSRSGLSESASRRRCGASGARERHDAARMRACSTRIGSVTY